MARTRLKETRYSDTGESGETYEVEMKWMKEQSKCGEDIGSVKHASITSDGIKTKDVGEEGDAIISAVDAVNTQPRDEIVRMLDKAVKHFRLANHWLDRVRKEFVAK